MGIYKSSAREAVRGDAELYHKHSSRRNDRNCVHTGRRAALPANLRCGGAPWRPSLSTAAPGPAPLHSQLSQDVKVWTLHLGDNNFHVFGRWHCQLLSMVWLARRKPFPLQRLFISGHSAVIKYVGGIPFSTISTVCGCFCVFLETSYIVSVCETCLLNSL